MKTIKGVSSIIPENKTPFAEWDEGTISWYKWAKSLSSAEWSYCGEMAIVIHKKLVWPLTDKQVGAAVKFMTKVLEGWFQGGK